MSELLKKYEFICNSDTVVHPDDVVCIKDSLYGNLSVLDSKASALMAFDAILTAVASFTVQDKGVLASHPLVPLVVIILGLVAACLCLFVTQVSYQFLGKVSTTPASPAGPGIAATPASVDFSDEVKALAGAVELRTCFYQVAWWMSLIAIILFLIKFGIVLYSSL